MHIFKKYIRSLLVSGAAHVWRTSVYWPFDLSLNISIQKKKLKPGTHDANHHGSCLADGDTRTISNICTCEQRLCLLTSIAHASVLAYERKLKNFNFFGATDAGRVNSQHLYPLAKVLRVSYQFCEFLSKNRQFEISATSIYEASIVCTLFSLNQHTSVLAAGIRLLAYKHRVYGVLGGITTKCMKI